MSDYQFSTSSGFISSNGGFAFVERMLDSNAAMGGWNRLLRVGPRRRHRDEAVVRSLVLLMCAGCSNFADVEKFRDDCLFRAALGGRVPSEETLRQRLDTLAGKEWQPVLDACVAAQLSRSRPVPRAGDHRLQLPAPNRPAGAGRHPVPEAGGRPGPVPPPHRAARPRQGGLPAGPPCGAADPQVRDGMLQLPDNEGGLCKMLKTPAASATSPAVKPEGTTAPGNGLKTHSGGPEMPP